MKKTVICLLLLCGTFYTTVKAQQHLVDSIERELKTPLHDTARALSLMRLAIDYELVDTAKAFAAYKEAISFAKEKKLDYYLGRIYHNQYILFNQSARFAEVRNSIDSALICYERSNDHRKKKWMGNAYGDLGNLFNVQNEPEEAATYYLKAIAIFEKEGLLKDVVVRYSNLSKLFEQTKDYPAQQAYARKAIDAAKKGGDAFSLSVAYMAYAQAMNVVKKYPETKTAMDSAAVYFTADGTYIDYQTNFYLLYAVACQMNGQMACAKEYFQKCYDAAVRYSYKYGLAESQLQLGTIMVGERKFKEAENFLLNGIREAKELGYINMLYKGYEKLSGLYSESGRYREALEAYQQFKLLGDSMISMESKRTIAELEKQYETEKKDNHIVLQQAQLKQKSILNYILIGSAAALAIISLLGYRNYRHKHKLQQHRISELETENQLAATEAVLKGEAQERTRLAKDL
ncbi:MAG TPA: hypothetical protein PLR74_00560, partial [Agriterribacter sp.]|nr:hypothetical protein [Agriterribacter sp.]